MTIAKDIMTSDPLYVKPDTPVRDLAETLIVKNFAGAPVLDDDCRLVGIVTVTDVIYQKKNLHLPTLLTIFDAVLPLGDSHDLEDQMKKILGSTVGDIMTDDISTISPDTTLEEIATIMSEQGKYLLPVMEDEKVIGVVDRADVLKAIVKESKE